MVTRQYVVGLDLGPASAFTALAVVERADDEKTRDADPQLAVKHLQRFPPGTAYKAVASAVGKLLTSEELADAPVVVDVTAVGTGVLDLFKELEPQSRVLRVVVTAGHHAEYGPHATWLVPKKELVTGLQLLLQGRRLAIPAAMPEAALLARELGNFRAKVSLAADPLEAEWREGQDDDLVLAVALACWKAGRMGPPILDWEPACVAVGGRRGYLGRTLPDSHGRPFWWR
jgi:hypothetical protein